jgi:bifunctional ADP-heptose synthase (sugar kinase/adenylyltransferase)
LKELKNIQQLKSSKVLLIGDSCIDRYHYGTVERISPEAPVPIFKVLKTENKNGMSLNVKENLLGLGVSVGIVTNEKEIIKSRHIENKSRQHIIRVDWGEGEKVKPLSLDNIKDINFDQYDAVIISDYNKGFITKENISQILNFTNNTPVFVDTKKKDLRCYENCIIKINEKEKKEVTNFPKNYSLIVTLGERGALYNNVIYPTDKVEVFDVCGAGDTFISALCSYYIFSKNMVDSIMFANRCAGFVVQKFGTYALKKKDLNEICI